ncbi:MAG TPA: MFS transporter [Verrucomicrobiae bacterium]|nr:MFS transporter [Verrucomicrobiae bacterium]
MSLSERLAEIRTGFEPAFWVANVSELFERLAYYGAFASLATYLHESLNFSVERTSDLTGFFGGLVWFLAILGGTVADRLGFRRALSTAYLILAVAYFLIGSVGAPWMAPVRATVPLEWIVLAILVLPALGISMVKPSVVGTTADAAKENVRSIGYSIYYTVVNIGGAAGPWIASYAHKYLGAQSVFRVSALSVLLMFFAVQLFFREPKRSSERKSPTLRQTLRNFLTVLSNPRFLLFLLLFSGYWVCYWQEFIALPLYLRAYVDPHADVERILMTDATCVIFLQMIVSHLMRKVPAFRAIILGTLVSGVAWLIIGFHASVMTAVLSIVVVALGEMIQQPPYYEYVSRLAPEGQQGTYMGFAFVPLGIGSLVGGKLGGALIHHYGEVLHQPQKVWWAITAIGTSTALLLWIYDLILKPGRSGKTPA